MITVQEAVNLINQHTLHLEMETLPLAKCIGKILGEPLVADRDFPPYHRVTMDGIAVRFGDNQRDTAKFSIVGVQAAGSAPQTLESSEQAIEVMTGAVLPNGADTVIPYESISISGGNQKTAILEIPIEKGRNIHRQGSDRIAGETIVKAGVLMSAPEIGVAATVGKSHLKVVKPPTVAIISTGDELVEVDQTPLPHQIRSSNGPTMEAALNAWHIDPEIFHILDNLEGTTNKLGQLIGSNDILLLSGGVSKGKFDFVPKALDKLGVKQHFHRISQRPGKPFWFGTHPSGTMVFAFPGNPVSSFMCFQRYLKPWLNQVFRLPSPVVEAQLSKEISFTPDLTYMAQIKLKLREGKLYADPVKGHGSGDLANLADADGFIELPKEKSIFKAGEIYPVYPFRAVV